MKVYSPTHPKKAQRFPFTAPSLETGKILQKKRVRTWSRSSVILASYVGKYFEVYNGKSFVQFLVRPEMVGYKLGEFSRTRRRGKDPRPKTRQKQRK